MVKAYNFEKFEYELKGKARTFPDIFRVVLGPCAQCCLCEASEQKKMGPKTKIYTLKDRALTVTSFDSSRKNKQFEKYNFKIG